MTGELGQLSLITDPTSSLKIDCHPSDCTEEHYVSLPGIEHMSVELRKNIWLFIYMAWHWTLPNRLINITLHIHIRVHLWLAISCIMTCIMIVNHTNRLDNFSPSSCTVPSCRLVGWLCNVSSGKGTGNTNQYTQGYNTRVFLVRGLRDKRENHVTSGIGLVSRSRVSPVYNQEREN